MNDRIEIQPCGPVNGAVRPPGSKSITNRAFVCAALARGVSRLSGVLDSEDTRVMMDSLGRLGWSVRGDLSKGQVEVESSGGGPRVNDAGLFVGNSGTTIRFLTAVAATGFGRIRLDGVERMRQRPIGDLLKALTALGANLRAELGNDCPPVIAESHGLPGGRTVVRGDISSQFLSGLLMAAPAAKNAVEVVVEGELVSKPYVEMTLALMREFGVNIEAEGLSRFRIEPQAYQPRDYAIEPDASAASYFWAAAAISGGRVRVEGLSRDSLQGDVAFCDCLRQMGCDVQYESQGVTVAGKPLRGIEVDMNAISDTAQTLAVVALFAQGSTTIRGVGHIRHKETDRVGDLARELRRLGAEVVEHEDGLTITPQDLRGAEIETYNDHRMAMSLALAGLRVPGVVIKNPRCTEKTYPGFFHDFAALCKTAQ